MMVMMMERMDMVVTMRMATVILMPIWRQADKLPVSKRWGGDPIKDISDQSHRKTEYDKHHIDSIMEYHETGR